MKQQSYILINHESFKYVKVMILSFVGAPPTIVTHI